MPGGQHSRSITAHSVRPDRGGGVAVPGTCPDTGTVRRTLTLTLTVAVAGQAHAAENRPTARSARPPWYRVAPLDPRTSLACPARLPPAPAPRPTCSPPTT